MNFPSRDFTDQFISLSYQDIVQQYNPDPNTRYLLNAIGTTIVSLPLNTQSVLLDSEQTSSMIVYSASMADFAIFADTASLCAESISSSYADTSSVTVFNGDRSIKRSPYSGINVGGNDVVAFLNNFFFPFISSTIDINSGTSYYETGSSQNITINATITINDETSFESGSIKKDNISIYTSSIPCPLTFGYTDNSVTSNHTYYGYVQVDNNNNPTVIGSSAKTINFIYPFLYGLSASSSLDSGSLYTTLTKNISIKSSKTINLVETATYIYFAYPSSYGNLVSIIDPNLFNITSDFTSTDMGVTSSGLTVDWKNTYKIYRLNNLANPNGNFQFNF